MHQGWLLIGLSLAYLGLLFSYYYNVPASPAIILAAGAFYFLSITLGPQGGLLRAYSQWRARRRRMASLLEHD